MAKTDVAAKQPEAVVTLMQGAEVVRVLVVGAIVGLVAVALYFALSKYVFTPLMCGGEGLRCSDKMYFANGIAVFVGAAVGLFALIRQRVYRPLLVVLLALVALWQLIPVGIALNGWLLAVFAALLYALAYAAFAWIVQLRSFVLAVILSLLLSAGIWWLLVA